MLYQGVIYTFVKTKVGIGMKYEMEYYCTSNTGRVRRTNQDNLYCVGKFMESVNNGTDGILNGKVNPSATSIFAVFDGMGGEERGELAAYLSAKIMAEYSFESNIEKMLLEFCKRANAEICNYAENHGINSMGTTAAILVCSKKKIGLCNIGDSKVFRCTKGKLEQISKDHVSISPFLVKPPLTQNLGIPETELLIAPYIATGEYQAEDIYLICSDGLTDMVKVEDIQKILLDSKKEQAAENLLECALANGGRDNITLIVLFVKKKKIFKR